MCIQTKVQKLQAQKEALDAQIKKLEELEYSTTPVKNLLASLLANYATEASEELPIIWEEILAIGQQHGLSVQPLAADELQQWEADRVELENLRLEVRISRLQLPQVQPDNEPKVWRKREIAPELKNLSQEALVENTEADSLSVLTDKEYDAAVEEELALDDDEKDIPALTLWQPWATLIEQEVKRVETRSWSTNYRGPIAIHAAKKPVAVSDYPHLFELMPYGCEFPFGAVVAIANLIDCVKMTPKFIAQQSKTELMCGDWRAGRFAWILEIIRPVVPPIPVSGGQKLWNWSGTSIAAELEYLEKLKTTLEPGEVEEQQLNTESETKASPTSPGEIEQTEPRNDGLTDGQYSKAVEEELALDDDDSSELATPLALTPECGLNEDEFELVEMAKAAILECDSEMIKSVNLVFKEVCEKNAANRVKVWNSLTEKEQQTYKLLLQMEFAKAPDFAEQTPEYIVTIDSGKPITNVWISLQEVDSKLARVWRYKGQKDEIGYATKEAAAIAAISQQAG